MSTGEGEEGNLPVRRTSRARKVNPRFVGDDIDESYMKLVGRITASDYSKEKPEKSDEPAGKEIDSISKDKVSDPQNIGLCNESENENKLQVGKNILKVVSKSKISKKGQSKVGKHVSNELNLATSPVFLTNKKILSESNLSSYNSNDSKASNPAASVIMKYRSSTESDMSEENDLEKKRKQDNLEAALHSKKLKTDSVDTSESVNSYNLDNPNYNFNSKSLTMLQSEGLNVDTDKKASESSQTSSSPNSSLKMSTSPTMEQTSKDYSNNKESPFKNVFKKAFVAFSSKVEQSQPKIVLSSKSKIDLPGKKLKILSLKPITTIKTKVSPSDSSSPVIPVLDSLNNQIAVRKVGPIELKIIKKEVFPMSSSKLPLMINKSNDADVMDSDLPKKAAVEKKQNKEEVVENSSSVTNIFSSDGEDDIPLNKLIGKKSTIKRKRTHEKLAKKKVEGKKIKKHKSKNSLSFLGNVTKSLSKSSVAKSLTKSNLTKPLAKIKSNDQDDLPLKLLMKKSGVSSSKELTPKLKKKNSKKKDSSVSEAIGGLKAKKVKKEKTLPDGTKDKKLSLKGAKGKKISKKLLEGKMGKETMKVKSLKGKDVALKKSNLPKDSLEKLLSMKKEIRRLNKEMCRPSKEMSVKSKKKTNATKLKFKFPQVSKKKKIKDKEIAKETTNIVISVSGIEGDYACVAIDKNHISSNAQSPPQKYTQDPNTLSSSNDSLNLEEFQKQNSLSCVGGLVLEENVPYSQSEIGSFPPCKKLKLGKISEDNLCKKKGVAKNVVLKESSSEDNFCKKKGVAKNVVLKESSSEDNFCKKEAVTSKDSDDKNMVSKGNSNEGNSSKKKALTSKEDSDSKNVVLKDNSEKHLMNVVTKSEVMDVISSEIGLGEAASLEKEISNYKIECKNKLEKLTSESTNANLDTKPLVSETTDNSSSEEKGIEVSKDVGDNDVKKEIENHLPKCNLGKDPHNKSEEKQNKELKSKILESKEIKIDGDVKTIKDKDKKKVDKENKIKIEKYVKGSSVERVDDVQSLPSTLDTEKIKKENVKKEHLESGKSDKKRSKDSSKKEELKSSSLEKSTKKEKLEETMVNKTSKSFKSEEICKSNDSASPKLIPSLSKMEEKGDSMDKLKNKTDTHGKCKSDKNLEKGERTKDSSKDRKNSLFEVKVEKGEKSKTMNKDKKNLFEIKLEAGCERLRKSSKERKNFPLNIKLESSSDDKISGKGGKENTSTEKGENLKGKLSLPAKEIKKEEKRHKDEKRDKESKSEKRRNKLEMRNDEKCSSFESSFDCDDKERYQTRDEKHKSRHSSHKKHKREERHRSHKRKDSYHEEQKPKDVAKKEFKKEKEENVSKEVLVKASSKDKTLMVQSKHPSTTLEKGEKEGISNDKLPSSKQLKSTEKCSIKQESIEGESKSNIKSKNSSSKTLKNSGLGNDSKIDIKPEVIIDEEHLRSIKDPHVDEMKKEELDETILDTNEGNTTVISGQTNELKIKNEKSKGTQSNDIRIKKEKVVVRMAGENLKDEICVTEENVTSESGSTSIEKNNSVVKDEKETNLKEKEVDIIKEPKVGEKVNLSEKIEKQELEKLCEVTGADRESVSKNLAIEEGPIVQQAKENKCSTIFNEEICGIKGEKSRDSIAKTIEEVDTCSLNKVENREISTQLPNKDDSSNLCGHENPVDDLDNSVKLQIDNKSLFDNINFKSISSIISVFEKEKQAKDETLDLENSGENSVRKVEFSDSVNPPHSIPEISSNSTETLETRVEEPLNSSKKDVEIDDKSSTFDSPLTSLVTSNVVDDEKDSTFKSLKKKIDPIEIEEPLAKKSRTTRSTTALMEHRLLENALNIDSTMKHEDGFTNSLIPTVSVGSIPLPNEPLDSLKGGSDSSIVYPSDFESKSSSVNLKCEESNYKTSNSVSAHKENVKPPISSEYNSSDEIIMHDLKETTPEVGMGELYGDIQTPFTEVTHEEPKVERELTEEEKEEIEKQNVIVVSERLKSFEHLQENLYLVQKIRNKRSKEVRRMVCDCTLSKEEMLNNEMGCGDDCINKLLMIECGSRCPLQDHCMNKQFQKKKYAEVEVFNAVEKGCGLRACQDIPLGTFILEYIGEVFDTREFKRRRKEYAKESNAHFYFMALRSDRLIDATRKGNISRFINHSCSPNAETQKWTVNGDVRIGFFATKFIKAGEEINFDYRLERYGREPQKCYCGTPECRGWLGEAPDEKTKEEKEEDRKKEIRDKKKREEKRLYFEDMDLEDEIEKLHLRGLRNRQDTLNLSRLMVRAEDVESRRSLLKLLEYGEQACKRLFLDYHGLKLLWSWMVDISSSQKCEPLKLEILKILSTLPITNKTQLTDSRVLSIVERWSKSSNKADQVTAVDVPEMESIALPKDSEEGADKKSSDTSEDSDAEVSEAKCVDPSLVTASPDDSSSLDSNEESAVQNKDDVTDECESDSQLVGISADNKGKDVCISDASEFEETENLSVAELASKLLPLWNNLNEAFRIPKKERIELMKEHEREVDKEYKEYLDKKLNSTGDRTQAFYDRWRYSVDKDKFRERREKKRSWRKSEDEEEKDKSLSGLSKEERRERFALKVAKEDEEARQRKLQEEMWTLHIERCSLLGHDPYFTPIFDPSGQYYWDPNAGSWQPYVGPNVNLPVPATYGVLQTEGLDSTQANVQLGQMFMPGAFYPLPHTPVSDGEGTIGGQGTPILNLDPASIPLPGESPLPQHSPLESSALPNSLPGEGEDMDIHGSETPPLPPPGPITIVLPPKWKLARDKERHLYFYHTKTRYSQWELPTEDLHQKLMTQYGLNSDSDSDFESDTDSSSSSDSEYFSSDDDENEDEEKEDTLIQVSEDVDEKMIRRPKGKKKRSEKLVQERVISPILFEDREAARRERKEAKERAREEARKERWEMYKSVKVTQTKVENEAAEDVISEDNVESPKENEDDEHLDMQLLKFSRKQKQMESKSHTKGKSKERAATAMADTSDIARKIKDSFRSKMATYIVSVLNPYRKLDCKEGRITSNDDFKYLARKLTHFVMVKELKQLPSIDGLDCSESVKHKTREFVRKYMSKYGNTFKRDPNDTKEY